jgi:AraC-like DNA-binding protein
MFNKNNLINPVKIPFIEDRIILFNEIYDTLRVEYSIDNLYYANMCLWHFLSSFLFFNQYSRARGYEEKKSFIDEVILLMKQHINGKIKLRTIAERTGYSVQHFSSLFRKKTGYTPIEYFIHLKMQRACQFLASTDKSIKEISGDLGYLDPYYFSRLFKNIIGISPCFYRQKIKKG